MNRKDHEPRISGGYSLHERHDPDKCEQNRCFWRVVDCCEQEPDRDVLECAICGLQRSAPCDFDEEMS